MNQKQDQIVQAVATALIDQSISSNENYQPQFVINDHMEGKKVLAAIEEELKHCDSFLISVAFITMSGITPLLQTFKELEQKNIHGKILTTNYLCFSEPKALERLRSFSNIELRMADVDQSMAGFHTKGYIFFSQDNVRMIIGSSNLTQSALTINKEWNIRLVCQDKGVVPIDVLKQFYTLWNDRFTLPYSLIEQKYKEQYQKLKKERKKKETFDLTQSVERLVPNAMQERFIARLRHFVQQGKKRALLVSATGTGKTFAAGFAMRELKFKRVLFIVHREIIAKQAKESFEKVFSREGKTFGLFTSKEKQNTDYLFTTMQTMSKEKSMEQFSRDEFDAIIIDEVHRAGARSYQKIFEYFEPKLWLGMSATPERSDDFDIYALFDHNIAYEIRLDQALEENLLCPFHYYGIQDLFIDDQQCDVIDFQDLVCDRRVDHIIEQANFYGYSGDQVKGLIFVSRIEEARELSKKFNEKGYRTVCLSGSDSQEVRHKCIEQLNKGDLDYIFTVEIFNEGVDIPSINQVIMLRQTQSPIIFVQQMGRGLRKSEGKEYVVILDFIGNYQNNYMIPMALSSDRTYNKDTLRRFVMEGERIIPGSSTIHFDEVSKREIFRSIDRANLQTLKLLKDGYKQLRNQLGRIPTLLEFDEFGQIDPLKIIDHCDSYPAFLLKCEKDHDLSFDEKELGLLKYVSKWLVGGKRIQELLIMEMMLNGEKNLFRSLEQKMHRSLDPNEKINLIHIFTNEFLTGIQKKNNPSFEMISQENGDYQASRSMQEALKNKDLKDALEQLVELGLSRYHTIYENRKDHSPFVLYEKYTYEDVCRLLNWEKGEVALNIGGYKYDQKTQTYPVFINYNKDDTISETTRYEDRFLSPNLLKAISKSKRTIASADVQTALNAKELGIQMFLFVRKNKDDHQSKEFYCLGRIFATGNCDSIMVGNENAVEIEYRLETPVRQDIYDYVTN